jgi:diguanylate cyclase (GGDEF)-like protein/PAS domain S-box-containing protein
MRVSHRMRFNFYEAFPHMHNYETKIENIAHRQSSLKISDVLVHISDAVSGCVADDYFKALVTALSQQLMMDIVFIGRVEESSSRSLQTKTLMVDGKIIDNITYKLADTPCDNVLKKIPCIHPQGIQKAFPKDMLLQEMGVEGYMGAPLFSASGKPIGILVTLSRTPIKSPETIAACFNMVAGRTAAEMERMLTEEHLRKLSQIVEQSPVSVMMTDTEGNLEYVNKHFEKTSGYTKEEVIGHNPRILKSGHTAANEYAGLWDNLRKGKNWIGEFHNSHKDGSLYWERASLGPLKNTQDEITNYVAIKEEISKEKEAEKESLLASAVFQTATEAVMVTDVNNKIMKVNKAFSKITGYSSEEAVGKSPSLLQSGHHDQHYYTAMFQELEANDTWSGEIWNRRKSGEAYPEWLAISAMRDSEGVLEGYVSLFSDITKRKQNEARIIHQANFDSLTGLANRSLFADRLSRSLELAEREHTNLALLFIGLDNFKVVNETLGHSIGDQLLQEVATRLINCLRKSDTVARLGADEFAVVISGNDSLHNVEDTVNTVLDCIAEPYCLEGHDAFVSASVGVSVYPQDGTDTENLLRKADAAMYRAKEKGRNNAQFFTLEMDVEAQERRELEKMLRRALVNEEFTLNYQPIIDMDTGTISSAEALIRWNHPVKGLISPLNFIPLAEENGLIVPIGEWVLREACTAAVSWQKYSDESPCVSVNLSSYQLQKQNIPELVEKVLAESGLAAEKLILEITESLLISDDTETLNQLQNIRDLGVKISIDDFGTGYSSLSYLKKFPISNLKIDRSFIMGLPDDHEDAALVNAIVAMSQSLGLKVIAEGVETQQQADFLKAINCQWIQGYLNSKPLPESDFIDYLQKHRG